VSAILATATWEPLPGDPSATERGRWVVKSLDVGVLGLLAAGQDDVDRVGELLRELLADAGYTVGVVAVSLGDHTVTAYAPEDRTRLDAAVDEAMTAIADTIGSEPGGAGPVAARSEPSPPNPDHDLPAPSVGPGNEAGSVAAEPATVRGQVAPGPRTEQLPDRAEMLQRIAALVAGGLPVPGGIQLWSHCRGVDLSWHERAVAAASVRAWAQYLGLADPAYRSIGVSADVPYRALRATGVWLGYDIDLIGYVDVADDPAGLDGTGWLVDVWVAVARKGVAAHRPVGDERTACGRSTRTGERTTARQAQDRWSPSWSCHRCWPDGSPITAPEGGDDRG